MLVEHVHTVLLQRDGGWPVQIGRLAFPMFALAFALAVGERAPLRSYRAAFRLAPLAVLAQVGSVAARSSYTLNVLFLFVAAAAWVAAQDERVIERYCIRGLCLLVAFFSEFWWPGLAVIVGLVAACRWQGSRWGVVVVWVGLVACGLWEHTFAAFGFVVVAAAVLALDLQARRLPYVFGGIYVIQFPVFLLVRWLHG